MTTRPIPIASLDALHGAWTNAATEAERGATRLLYVRGMVALRAKLPLFQAYAGEANALLELYAKRDERGDKVSMLDAGGAALPGRYEIGSPDYLPAMKALSAQRVDVELPDLTRELLEKTGASAESLALLLPFIVVASPHEDRDE